MRALLIDAVRGLRSRGAATTVAIIGMSLALTACLLVALLAKALTDPAPQIPEPEHLIMLDFKGNPPGMPSPWFTRSPVSFGPMLKQRQVALDLISRASQQWLDIEVQGVKQPLALLAIDPDLVPLLGLRALLGDLPATLLRRDAIAITPARVRKQWGELPLQQALGRSLDLEGRVMIVTAIVPERDPRDPLWDYDGLVGFDSQANTMTEHDRQAVFFMNGRVFARLQPGVSVEQVGAWMRDAFIASPGFQELPPEWHAGREAAFFRALPLQRLPFEGAAQELRWERLEGLAAASALLLLMATLNLLSLQSAGLLRRQHETALRRSLGANGVQLIRLWVTESALLLLASAALALLLSWWLAPLLANGLGLDPRHPVADPMPGVVLLGLALTLGLLLPLTLLLPAWRALSRTPAAALQGRTASEGPWGQRARQGLLALQLGGALLLLALTGVLALQQHHLLTADRGYELRNRLYLGMQANPDKLPDLHPLIAALNSHPAIRHWAFSSMRPARDAGEGSIELYASADEHKQIVRVSTVSSSFFETYGIKLLAGQLRPAPEGGEAQVVIDAKAARALGFATPQAAIGAQLRGGGGYLQDGDALRRVVAVVGDIKLESARDPARPQAFMLSEAPQWDITVQGDDMAALERAVDEIWRQHGPAIQHEVQAVDTQRALVYLQEERLIWMLAAVALLAVAVAMLGAYALVADTLRRRRTELILRRLHGAGDIAIAGNVAREFAWPLCVAAVAGLPIAAWLGQRYLAGYVDRVDAGAGLGAPLALACLLMLLITALAALRHTRLALSLQPVEALR